MRDGFQLVERMLWRSEVRGEIQWILRMKGGLSA